MKRDLTQYQWKKDFHKLIWEKIKEVNTNYPRWSLEQLISNGWQLRLGSRGYIELRHTDGSRRNFLLSVNGQTMPHIAAMLWRIHGYGDDHRITRESIANAAVKFKELEPRCRIDKANDNSSAFFSFKSNGANAYNLFKELRDTPLDTSYTIDPNLTTSKKCVLDIILTNPAFEVRSNV